MNSFWEDSEYARKAYVDASPSEELILQIETQLGYKLPASYIALMKTQNGGIPIKTCFPTEDSIGWAEDHIAVTGFYSIGRKKTYSLCGSLGSAFMLEEWGYPAIGVVIADTPTAGHQVIMLDYRECGSAGEPKVAYVNQEWDYEITVLADTFEEFIRGLVNEEVFDTSAEDLEEALKLVASAPFSALLSELCQKTKDPQETERCIRTICTTIVEEKGYFAFHADEHSMLMYDIQFWLYTLSYLNTTKEEYLREYAKMIAFGNPFSTGGYAPDFIKDWLDDRQTKGNIIDQGNAIAFTPEALSSLMEQMSVYN